MNITYPGSLHNHTEKSNFRLRDCIVKSENLVQRAIELGQSVVAITDHETISEAVKVEELRKPAKQAIQKNKKGRPKSPRE